MQEIYTVCFGENHETQKSIYIRFRLYDSGLLEIITIDQVEWEPYEPQNQINLTNRTRKESKSFGYSDLNMIRCINWMNENSSRHLDINWH